MKAMLVAVAALAIALPIGVGGQSVSANPRTPKSAAAHDTPTFDVVSIKPTAPTGDKTLIQQLPDGTSFHGAPVRMVLQTAFGVDDDRIIGAPSWVGTNRYEIEAKVAPEDAPKLGNLKGSDRNAMLIPLLTERFNLRYHHEMRERPMYALVIAKGGPKLIKGEAFPTGGVPPGGVKPADGSPVDPAKEHYKIMAIPGQIDADSMPMGVLADVLSRMHVLGRMVVDKTGLTGNYNFSLRWTPDNSLPAIPNQYSPGTLESGLAHSETTSDPAGSLFAAIEEQLGLKLESEKDRVDVIVIDHIDPPSPN